MRATERGGGREREGGREGKEAYQYKMVPFYSSIRYCNSSFCGIPERQVCSLPFT